MWGRPYRAVCEHTLKIASWSVLIAAVSYLADKSGNWKLRAAYAILIVALFGYINSLVVNLYIDVFPPDELQSRARWWTTMIVNVVITCLIVLVLIQFSFAIISAFVQLQAQK